jgi:hypothetical protein
MIRSNNMKLLSGIVYLLSEVAVVSIRLRDFRDWRERRSPQQWDVAQAIGCEQSCRGAAEKPLVLR